MNDQNNPLDPEGILWWKNHFKALDTEGIGIDRKELIEDFWARDFPLEETLAICLIKWPNTTLECVKSAYEDMDNEFYTEMAELLKKAKPTTLQLKES